MIYNNYLTRGCFDIHKITFCSINENINEMLYNSYNIDQAEHKIKDKFNSVKSIEYVKMNNDGSFYPVDWKSIDKGTGFFKFELYNLNELEKICDYIKTSYGWFPYSLYINNYIGFADWNNNGKFITIVNNKEIELREYVHNILKNNVNSIMLFFEAKYTFRELRLYGDIFHVTDMCYLNKIQKMGLVPKQKINGPHRIYFSKDYNDVMRMIDGKIEKPVVLRLNIEDYGDEINKIKFYKDPRTNNDAFFTYDNIKPEYIQYVIGNPYDINNRKLINLTDLGFRKQKR